MPMNYNLSPLDKLKNYKNHIRNGIKNGYNRRLQELRRTYVFLMGGLAVGLVLLFLGIFVMFVYFLFQGIFRGQ